VPPQTVAPGPKASPEKPVAGPASPDLEREAADKRARENLERSKAEREAKAKALTKQREQEAARQAAEQEAERQLAEAQRQAAQRPPPTAPDTAPPTTAVTPQAKTVKQICAGRSNFVSTALCESRACNRPEHGNDPTCRQFKADEEARKQRQYQ
jgi:hypothetical protein